MAKKTAAKAAAKKLIVPILVGPAAILLMRDMMSLQK